jgi:hypothetical protein
MSKEPGNSLPVPAQLLLEPKSYTSNCLIQTTHFQNLIGFCLEELAYLPLT